jgi:nucleotide-binding universal stress UspA family protein
MQKFSRILAAVDFSKPADGAFDYALALSQEHGAELVVVQAVPLDHAYSEDGRARLDLAAELQQKADAADVALSVRVQQGDPAEIILLHARTLRPDAIVIGTHQRTGLDRLRMGSVAERVAAKATVPVLLVPQRHGADAVRPFRHVAVAVDFSDASKRAIDHALTLARDPDDRITLLHVVPGFSSGVPPYLYRYGAAEYQSHLVGDARRRLQRAVPVKRESRATIHARVLVGDTAAEITRVVDQIDADVLIVGVPQRNVVQRALVGTTAARLLKTAAVPMLAVPEVATAGARAEGSALRAAA